MVSKSLIVLALTAILYARSKYNGLRNARRRKGLIPASQERVLILGASSGVGQALAKQYSLRKARICVVARRQHELDLVARECGSTEGQCFAFVADLSNVEEMCALRERIVKEWGGLDTVHVCAGVSALQPVMTLAGVEMGATEDASGKGIAEAVGIAGRAMKGNFEGPFVAALTFIPLLTRTSVSPSILLMNTLASAVAAPTRGLYAASKASSLLLYQSLAIEHPKIAFTFLLPGTIEGNFRSSAVDSGPVHETDPDKNGLKREYVAEKCVSLVDSGIRNNVFLPWWPSAVGPHLYALWPAFVEQQARIKYNFK